MLLDLGGRRRLLTTYLFIALAALAAWLPVAFLLFGLPLLTSLLGAVAVSGLAAIITLPMAYAGMDSFGRVASSPAAHSLPGMKSFVRTHGSPASH